MKTYSEFLKEANIDPSNRDTIKFRNQVKSFQKDVSYFLTILKKDQALVEAALGGRSEYTNLNSEVSDVFVKVDQLLAALR